MSNSDELKRQEVENLKKIQEEKDRLEIDDIKKGKFSPENPNLKKEPISPLQKDNKPSLHAPLFPCPKCMRTHRKGQACGGI